MVFGTVLETKFHFDNYQGYDRAARNQNWQAPKLLIEKLLKITPEISTDLKVIDVGCGTGISGEFFIENKNHIDGIDISSKMLDIARIKGGYQNLFKLDFTNKSDRKKLPLKYDLIICSGVIGEFTPIIETIQGLSDLGKDKCRLAFCGGKINHKRNLIFKILKSEGFNIESCLKEKSYIRYYIPQYYDFYIANRGL